MSKSRSTIAAITLLLATGAGCFGLGGDSAPTAATGGIWLSENSGSSWIAKSTLPTATGTASINGLDILTLEQDPSDDSAIYLGSKTSGVFYSLDSGESWMRPENQFAASGSVLDIEVDPRNVCTYYVLKADRLLKTETCGREFDVETYVETRTDESLTSLALDWYNPNTVFIGTTQGDIIRSLDGGATWTAVFRARNSIVDFEMSNADSRIILAGTAKEGIFRSVDGGTTWSSLEESLKLFPNADKVLGFSQTADGSRILLRSAFGLMTSDDNGATWIGLRLVTGASAGIAAAEVAPHDKNLIYYSSGATFYTSTSGGSAWSTSVMPSTRLASIIHVDEGNQERVYLGVMAVEKD
ncbi:MAG: hypothetical protein AAB776_01350 [Patescibacteria group bacterium]